MKKLSLFPGIRRHPLNVDDATNELITSSANDLIITVISMDAKRSYDTNGMLIIFIILALGGERIPIIRFYLQITLD